GLSTLVHWHCRRKWISARSRPCPNRPGGASSTHRDGDWPFRDKGRKASDGEGILEPYRRDGEMPRGRGTRRGDPRGAIPRQTGSRTADAAKAQSRTGRITGPVPRLGEAFGPDRTARSPGKENRSRNRRAAGSSLRTRLSLRRNRRRRERRAMRGRWTTRFARPSRGGIETPGVKLPAPAGTTRR